MAPVNFKADPNVVQNIPMDLIQRDLKWNSRLALAGEGKPDGSEGYKGLVKSLATTMVKHPLPGVTGPSAGQREPIKVRPNAHYGKDKSARPFLVVAGFQRYAAIEALSRGDESEMAMVKELITDTTITNKDAGALLVEKPTIRCIVQNMSDEEARWENLEENVGQNALSQPDIAYGIADLKRMSPETSDASIADRLGMSQNHVSQMLRIHRALGTLKLDPATLGDSQTKPVKLLDHWRASLVKVPVKDMDLIGKLPTPEEQIKAYAAQALTRASAPPNAGGRGQFLGKAKEDAEKIGMMLGGLARQGVLTVTPELFSMAFAAEILAPIQKLNGKATDDDKQEVAIAARKGYETGRNTIPVTDTSEQDKANAKAAKEAEKAAKDAAKAAEKAAKEAAKNAAAGNGKGAPAQA